MLTTMRMTSARLKLIPLALILAATAAFAAQLSETPPSQPVSGSAPVSGSLVGLSDSAGLRATVFGTPPQDMASLPAKVPLSEINIELPWRLPLPKILWFDSKLRVWFSAQDRPAPLAIVISGTGNDGNTKTISVLRAALYGAGYHVLTMPSPTFPGFIVSASRTGVAGELMQDGSDLYSAAAGTLNTGAEFSAAIAMAFRLQLIDMFFIGDLYAKTGVITDPAHPPKLGDSLEDIQRDLRAKPFADYFTQVFAPYYLMRRPDPTSASLFASNRLDIFSDALHDD